MPSIQVLNMQGASVGEMQLKDEIFAIEPNTAAMHLVVRSILANKRQGTQSALTRGMVFAVKPRDYRFKVPKKVRRLAMAGALTTKYVDGDMIVLDKIEMAEAKTRIVAKMLKDLSVEKRALLVLPGRDESVIRATKNLPLLDDCYVNTLNVYDILRANKLIVTREAMENIQEVYA